MLGVAAFASLALLLAGSVRAEATLAAANLIYVVLLVGGAVVVPASSYPEAMGDVVTLLPSGALAEGLRDALNGRGSTSAADRGARGVGGVAAFVTSRSFRWE